MATQSTDERAVRRLIKRATSRRDWPLVERMFAELGAILEDQETERSLSGV